MHNELIARAVLFLRIGMNAFAMVSFQAFLNARQSDDHIAEAMSAVEREDWTRLADILEYEIGPAYGVAVQASRQSA
jgi:hypothetical protein